MPGLNSWGLRWLGHHGRPRGAPAGQGAELGTAVLAVFAAEPCYLGDVVGPPLVGAVRTVPGRGTSPLLRQTPAGPPLVGPWFTNSI